MIKWNFKQFYTRLAGLLELLTVSALLEYNIANVLEQSSSVSYQSI